MESNENDHTDSLLAWALVALYSFCVCRCMHRCKERESVSCLRKNVNKGSSLTNAIVYSDAISAWRPEIIKHPKSCSNFLWYEGNEVLNLYVEFKKKANICYIHGCYVYNMSSMQIHLPHTPSLLPPLHFLHSAAYLILNIARARIVLLASW